MPPALARRVVGEGVSVAPPVVDWHGYVYVDGGPACFVCSEAVTSRHALGIVHQDGQQWWGHVRCIERWQRGA